MEEVEEGRVVGSRELGGRHGECEAEGVVRAGKWEARVSSECVW